MAEPNHIDDEKRTLILTGASRGIGHATVKRFSSAGWRVITCSRHAFPENCPWAAGPEDHIQVDLSDPADTMRAAGEMRSRLTEGKLHALVNNAAISPKGPKGERLLLWLLMVIHVIIKGAIACHETLGTEVNA